MDESKNEDTAIIFDNNEKSVLQKLKKNPSAYRKYLGMDGNWQECFLDFCSGKRTLPLLYDPFFKIFFHPDIHPDRLSRFISSLIRKKVRVKGILPSEDSLLDGSVLLIMDILVELDDGSLANVEIQKVPYLFPGRYIHYGKTVFDTGLPLELLQEYCLTALDVFREIPYPKDENEQTGWLSLLTIESPAEAVKLVQVYPWLAEIYQEMAAYRNKPEEVLGMFSEALRQIDRNTVQYMIEEQAKLIKQNEKTLKENEKIICEKDNTIKSLEAEIAVLKQSLQETNKI